MASPGFQRGHLGLYLYFETMMGDGFRIRNWAENGLSGPLHRIRNCAML